MVTTQTKASAAVSAEARLPLSPRCQCLSSQAMNDEARPGISPSTTPHQLPRHEALTALRPAAHSPRRGAERVSQARICEAPSKPHEALWTACSLLDGVGVGRRPPVACTWAKEHKPAKLLGGHSPPFFLPPYCNPYPLTRTAWPGGCQRNAATTAPTRGHGARPAAS